MHPSKAATNKIILQFREMNMREKEKGNRNGKRDRPKSYPVCTFRF